MVTETASEATARLSSTVVTRPPRASTSPATTISTIMIPAHSSQRSCVRSAASASR